MVAWAPARSSYSRLTLAVTWLTLAPDLSCLAQGQGSGQAECFSTSSMVGAVLGTFFATLAALAVAFLFWWICFRRRFNQEQSAQPTKRPSNVETGVGFDNPCFEEHPGTDVADGTKSTDDGRQEPKSTSWTPLRFFEPSRNQKKRSLDDSFITEPERVSVQLRGYDFTGLGFKVMGNMRDGIYIKDIQNRGPAFESGKIAEGDKILSVTISFRHVVLEDASTILRYASPYDITLELEKTNGTGINTLKQRKATSATSLAGSGSSIVAVSSLAMPDAPHNDRLAHPLYRSQSIDDLSKIGRNDAALKADVKIPSLSAQLGGGALIKSKMQTKANVEVELPHGPNVKVTSTPGTKDVTIDAGDISLAPPDASLTVEKPSKFAKFGIKVLPDFKFRRDSSSSGNSGGKPDTAVQVTLPKLPTGLEVAAQVPDLPKVEIHMPKASDVAIDVDIPDGPNIDVALPSVSVQLPSVPDVNVSSPGVQLSAELPDVAPAVDLVIDMDGAKLPKVDVDVPSVSLDINAPTVEFSAPEMSVSAPKIDVQLPDVKVATIEATPSLEGQIKVDLPDVSIEPKLPTLEIPTMTVAVPESGVKEAKSGFHIKFPKFGGAGGGAKAKVDVPDVSLGVAMPEVEVTLPEADTETETKTKKETAGAKGGFEFKMPKWDMKKKAAADVKIDLPDVEIQPATAAAGEISVDVKAPEASVEVPSVSVEAAGAKKTKIGFSMPKFHMGKGHVDIKDAPAVEVEIAAPKIEVAAPELNVELPQAQASAEVVLSDDETEASGAKKKSKFSLKMPKMPKGKVQADVEVGTVSLPKATVELKEDEAENVDDKDEAGGRSAKKSKFGLKMPKWNVNKPQVELEVQGAEGKIELPKIDVPAVDTALEASTSADISVNVPAMPSVDVELKSSAKDVTSDDEEEGGKKKAKFSLTMPKFGISKPQVELPEASASADVNVEIPKVEIEAKAHDVEEKTEKKKGFGFGFKMPKMGVSGAADIEASVDMPKEIQVNVPKVDVKVEGASAGEENDHEPPAGEKKKSKFSLKMPKFGMSKPQVDVDVPVVEMPTVEVSAEAPEAKIEVNVPEVDIVKPELSIAVAGPEVHDSDDEKDDGKTDKKKMKFGLKLPKFGINKPHAEVDVDINAPTVTATAPQVEIEAKGSDEPGEKKKHGFSISMPKFRMGGGAKAEVDVDLPDVSKEMAVEASVDLPSVEVGEAAAAEDGEHGGKKKFGLKMPKFGSLGLGKPQPDVDVSVEIDPSMDIDLPSASLGVSHDEADESKDADHNKGKPKFSIKMPKFHGSAAVPSAEVTGDMAAGVSVELPKVDVEMKRDEGNDSDAEAKKSKKGAKFGIKLPGLHIDKSHGDDSGDSSGDEDEAGNKKTKLGIKLPKIGFSKPQIDADVDVKVPSVDVEGNIQPPQVDIEAELSDDETGDKKKTKFGVQLPKLALKKPEVDVNVPSVDVNAEVNVPTLAVQVDVEPPKVDLQADLGDIPKVEIELPAASIDLGAGEDEAGGKKKSGMGFKLPKFGKKAVDLDIAVEGEAAIEADDDSDDEGADKKKSKFGIKMPKFGIKKPNVDVDLSSTKDIVVEADVEAPKIDLGDVAICAEIDVPKVEVDVPAIPAVELDIEAPSVDISAPEVSVDVPDLSIDAAKKKGKFSIDMPKINFTKPSFDIKLGKDVSVDAPKVEVEVPSSVELPSVTIEKPDIEVSVPSKEIEVAASVEVPKVDVDVEIDADIDVEKKKGKGFTFKMPKIHLGKQHAEVKADAPKDMETEISVDVPKVSADVDKIEIDLPKVGLDVAGKDDADSDDEKKESGKKKSHRFGIKMPKFHMNKPHAEVDIAAKELAVEGKATLPKVEVEVEEEHEAEDKRHGGKAKFAIKMPKFHLNKAVDVELAAKEEGKFQGAKDADSDDESGDKKSSAAIEVSVPKIGLEAPSLELDAGLSAEMPEAKIHLPKAEVDLKLKEKEELEKEGGKKKGKFSFKMPKFHGHGKSHGAEVEVASPSASLDPTINVNLPKAEIEVQAKGAESDDEAEGGEKKKSKFGLRMPKLRKPHVDVDVELPTATVTVPKVDLPTVAVPKVDLEATIQEDDESDDEKDKRKTKFGFKIPKIHGKPDVELSAPEVKGLDLGAAKVEIQLPAVDIDAVVPDIQPVEVDLPDLEAKMDLGFETESDEDKNKFGLGLDLTAPVVEVETNLPDLALAAVVPQVEVELPSVDVPVQPVELEINAPDVGSLDTAVDVKIKKPKFGFKLPSLGKPQADIGEVEANVEVPSASIEVKADESDSDDDKKPVKFGIKMPKFQLGKKEIAMEVPQVELSAETEDADDKPKAMKFDIDLPELKMIDPTLDVDLPNVPQIPEVTVPAQVDVEVKKPKFGIKLPVIEFNKPKVEVDVEVNKELPEVEISLPQEIEIVVPELEIPSVDCSDLSAPAVDVHLATESITECVNFDVTLPTIEAELPELSAPQLDVEGELEPSIDVSLPEVEIPKVDVEVPQIEATIGKKEGQDESSDSDSDDERGNKSSGFSFGLKMPKFSLGAKEKIEEPKVEIEVEAPKAEEPKAALAVEVEAPKVSVEVAAQPPQVVGEKEKKKFNLGLKMPKLNLSKGHAESEAKETGEVAAEVKPVKISVKPPKPEKKKKKTEEESDSDHSDDESKEKEAVSLPPKLSDVDIKLPRVQVYKSIEHPEGVRDHESRSSDDEDDVKDIKKNIGARFGVKLKKPKMFSSSKAEITKGDSSSALQPEWRLPRVDLRRTSRTDQELTVDIDAATDTKLEQLSPSERAEAIRRDAKMSAGIRVHSPGLVLASPRSKKEKSSLQLDVESQSSPRLLSVTRLDPTPPAEQPASQPIYIAAEVSGQVPASDVPSSVLMASEAVKLKRGPATPAKRATILDASSPTGFRAAIPVTSFEAKDVTPAPVISGEVSVIPDVDANQNDNGNAVFMTSVPIPNRAQVSDTDISITTSTGSDTLVISTVATTETPTSRKAASLGDLTRITHASSNNDDGALERTVSLDFKPVAPLSSSSSTTSRAIHNLAVQDLSRVGEDSDEDYSLNRKRPASTNFDANLNVEVTGVNVEVEAPHSPSKRHNRTLLAVDTDGSDVNIRPLDSDSAEALWFNRNIQIPDSTSSAHISYTHMESLSADVTMTTSLGTSPSDTSTSSSDGSPVSPASPEPSEGSLPLMQSVSQVENGSNQQYHAEVIEINQDELDVTFSTGISTRGVTVEVTSAEDESQPQPLTDLNPSAGNFAAVRNRFEQLSNRDTNGSEVTVTRTTPRLSQGGLVKRLSGTFEDGSGSVNLVQKSVMHIAPELSEGALSRTVIISSLQLDRSTETPSSVGTGVGPESPVPKLEPPC